MTIWKLTCKLLFICCYLLLIRSISVVWAVLILLNILFFSGLFKDILSLAVIKNKSIYIFIKIYPCPKFLPNAFIWAKINKATHKQSLSNVKEIYWKTFHLPGKNRKLINCSLCSGDTPRLMVERSMSSPNVHNYSIHLRALSALCKFPEFQKWTQQIWSPSTWT